MVKNDDDEQPLWERHEVMHRGPDGVVTVYRCFRRLSKREPDVRSGAFSTLEDAINASFAK